jgi:hypothetical protein
MSKNRKLSEILNDLDNGILPIELDYNIKENDPIDISKIQYNAFYRNYEFYQNKFPDGLQNLPGFNDYINYVVESKKNITPLEELEKIHELQIKEENNNIE